MSGKCASATSLIVRWLRFNFVGVLGVVVQMATLAMLAAIGTPYLIATALAVEAAVLHNYLWHDQYTWADRAVDETRHRLTRLLSFNLSNGVVSLVGNLMIMRLLVGTMDLPVLPANGVAILTCSAINFLLGEALVFRRVEHP